MTLIHTYCYGDGGFGDFIRSVYAYYVFCKVNDIQFYWYIVDHPFKDFFINDDVILEGSEIFVNIGSYDEKTKMFLDLIKNNKEKKYIVRSNVFNFVSFEMLKKYRQSFRQYLTSKMSPLLINRIRELKPDLEYSSMHLRCGDRFMPIINIGSDMRINLLNEQFQKDIKLVLDNLGENVVIFSDTPKVKNYIKSIKDNVILLNTNIQHTAIQGPYEGHLDSIAEFFILGLSKKIIVFSNSGFSFWSAFIYEVPLYRIHNGSVISFDDSDLKF